MFYKLLLDMTHHCRIHDYVNLIMDLPQDSLDDVRDNLFVNDLVKHPLIENYLDRSSNNLCRRNLKKGMIMAYNAIDIAKKIVCRTDVEHGDSVTNLKLRKLLYYLQGFHLAFFGTPLFNESIEAWTYGPVVPVVFQEFKKYKKRDINPDNYTDSLVLTDDEQQMFDMVYQEYNQFSAVALMNLTHNEGPWKNHDTGDVITHDELRNFFLTQIERND